MVKLLEFNGNSYLRLTFLTKIMPDYDYCKEIHSSVESIACHLLEYSEDQLRQAVEEEFDEEFYPPNQDLEEWGRKSENIYLKPSFGISALLAEDYSNESLEAEDFFSKRKNNFLNFNKEIKFKGNNLKSDPLVAYANLYTEIAENESIQTDLVTSSLLLQKLDGKKTEVKEMFQEIEEELGLIESV